MQNHHPAVLHGKNIAVLMTDGVEQIEYTAPRSFLEAHGAQVTLISPKQPGETVQGFNHLTPADLFPVEMSVADADSADFDALLLPGGVANPDQLRLSSESIDFIRDFARDNKPIAAICHGPWPLIDAGVAQGKRMTSWPSLKQDLSNAGADWTDQEVAVDGGLVTSRKPDDIPAFNQALLHELTQAAEQYQTEPTLQAQGPAGSIETTPELTVAEGATEVPNNVQEDPGNQEAG